MIFRTVVGPEPGRRPFPPLPEHDYFFDHGENLFDPSMRIPLLLAGPGIAAGRRTDALATTLDFVPTLLDALKVSYPPDLAGLSLLAAVRGEPLAQRARLAGQNDRDLIGVWGPRFKLVATPTESGARYALFDRARDPGETRDAGRANPEALREERRELELFRERIDAQLADPTPAGGPFGRGKAQLGGVREAEGDGLRAAGLRLTARRRGGA